MRIRTLLRLLCGRCFSVVFKSLALLLLSSTGAHAYDYFYMSPNGNSSFYPSERAACTLGGQFSSRSFRAKVGSGGFVGDCVTSGGNWIGDIYGAFCMTGKVYDPVTQACGDPPPPPPTPDECLATGPGIFSKSGPIVLVDGKNYVAVTGGGSACYGQCSHELQERAASCYSSGDGVGFCNYIGTPSGGTCSESDAPLGRTGDALNPPDTPDVPPSDPNDPGCPPGYGWSGTTCAKLPGDDGDTGGGDSGDDDTGGDTGGGGSGGGNSGGGDSGGGGDTGGGNSGGGDSGGGDSGGDTGGTGPGDGSGGGSGGDGDDGEDEEPTSSVGGESCDATLSCEGDAVQCAILRKQKEQVCMWRYGSLEKAQVEATLSGPDYELQEETLPVSGLFMEAVNKGRWLPQSCPLPERFTVMGRQFEMSYELICRFATALGPLLVIMASIFFAVYVGRAFKG